MGVAWKPPECQLRVVEGLPGAGKSFFLVRKALDIIQREKRPVYTNLPMRFRVVRQFLRIKSGEAYANLIVELTESHWRAFLIRNEQKQQFRNDYITKCKNDGNPFRRNAFQRAWLEEYGEDVTRPGTGQQPNWIPPLAVIIIDEVQHWHPMEANVKGNDAKGLKAYLTMMRHHLHDVYVASQVWTNVTKAMRDLGREFWRVKSLSDLRVVGGLRLKHLGIRAINYQAFSKEQIDAQKANKGEDDFGSTPLHKELIYPGLPKWQYIFRLYESFTHVQSPRQMIEDLKRAQDEAGVTELEEQLQAVNEVDKEDRVRFLMRLVMRSFATLAVLVAGVMIGAAIVGNPNTPPVPQLDDQGNPVSQTNTRTPPTEWWPPEAKITAINTDGIVTSEGNLKVGDRYGNARLRLIDPEGRRTLWVDRTDLWVWKLGHARPQRIAGREDLDRLDAIRRAPRISDSGPPIVGPRPDGG